MSSISLTNRLVLQRSCDSGLSSSSSSSFSSEPTDSTSVNLSEENKGHDCGRTSAVEDKNLVRVPEKRKFEGDSEDDEECDEKKGEEAIQSELG